MIENENKRKEQINNFQKLKEQIQDTFFCLYNSFHCLCNVSPLLSYVLIGLSFLVNYSFLINDEIGMFFPNNSSDFLKLLLRIFRFSFHIKDNTQILTAFCVVLLVIHSLCLVFLTFRLITIRDKPKSYSLLSKFYYYYTLLLFWVLLMPLVDINLEVFIYTDKTNLLLDTVKMAKYNSNILLLVICACNLFIILILIVLHCYLGHKSYFSTEKKDGLSRVDCQFEILYVLIRLINNLMVFITKKFLANKAKVTTDTAKVVINSVVNDIQQANTTNANNTINTSTASSIFNLNNSISTLSTPSTPTLIMIEYTSWYCLGITFILCLILAKFNWNKRLFYHSIPRHIFNSCIWINIWVYLVPIINILWKEFNPSWVLIPGIFIFFIEYHISEKHLNWLLNKASFTEFTQDTYTVDFYLKQILKLINTNSSEINFNNIIIYGIMENHLKECPYEKCLLRKKELFYLPYKNQFIQKEDYANKTKNLNYIFLLTQYYYFLKQNRSITILLSYFNYQIEEIGNLVELSNKLNSIDMNKPTLQEKFSMFRQRFLSNRKISESFNYSIDSDSSSNKYTVDIAFILEYYILVTKIKNLMIDSANSNFSFWSSFIYGSYSTSVYRNGLNIFSKHYEIHNIFLKLKAIFSGNYEIRKKYSDYIKLIKGDEREADKVFLSLDKNGIDDIKSLEKLTRINEFFFSPNTCIIIASFTTEKSMIEKVTESILGIYGYTPHQIIGKELETLMPPFFQKRHVSFINFHFSTGIKRVIGFDRYLYGYHRDGYIFPIRLLVMILPSVDKRLIYMGILQRIPEEQGVIIVEPNGKIDTISAIIMKNLKITPELVTEKELYIYHICSNYVFRKSSEVFDPDKFLVKESDNERFKYCKDISLIERIKESTNIKSKHTLGLMASNPNIGGSNTSNSFAKASSMMQKIDELHKSIDLESIQTWKEIDTEISKLVFNNGIDVKNNSLFVLQLFIDENESVNNSIIINNNELNHNPNIQNNKNINRQFFNTSAKIDQSNKLIEGITDINMNINKNNNYVVVKDLNNQIKESQIELLLNTSIKNNNANLNPSNLISQGLKRVKAEKNKFKNSKEKNTSNTANTANSNKKIKNKIQENISSIVVDSNFYSMYGLFKKKLDKCIREQTTNQFIRILGWALLFFLLLSSILIFVVEYENIQILSYSFEKIINQLTNYDKLNCIEQITNNELLSPYILPKNIDKMFYEEEINQMYTCINNFYVNKNQLNHILQNSVAKTISNELNNIDFKAIGFKNDSIRKELNTIKLLAISVINVDLLVKLHENYDKSLINHDLKYVKKNYAKVTDSIYNSTSTLIIKNYEIEIHNKSILNLAFLLIRLITVTFSFMIIVPILIIKKNDQIRILDSFFQIKNADADFQKDNCKYYISMNTNIQLDENKEESIVNKEIGSEDGAGGVNNNLDNEGNDKNTIKTNKDNKQINKDKDNKNKDKEIKDNNKDKDKKRSGNNKKGKSKVDDDEKFLNETNKKNTKNNSKSSSHKNKKSHFNSQAFILSIILFITIVILIISVVPIATYFIIDNYNQKTLTFIKNKLFIDKYANALQRKQISTQNLLLKQKMKINLSASQYDEFFKNSHEIANIEKDFSDFVFSSKNFDFYKDLDTFLYKSMCDIFVQKNFTVVDCMKFQKLNPIEGIIAQFGIISKDLNLVKNKINEEVKRSGTIEDRIVNDLINQEVFIRTNEISLKFSYIGFELIFKLFHDSYITLSNYNLSLVIASLVLFCLITIINQLFVWNKIEQRLYTMETDTYKLFAILPLKFIIQYQNLSEFLKKIAMND